MPASGPHDSSAGPRSGGAEHAASALLVVLTDDAEVVSMLRQRTREGTTLHLSHLLMHPDVQEAAQTLKALQDAVPLLPAGLVESDSTRFGVRFTPSWLRLLNHEDETRENRIFLEGVPRSPLKAWTWVQSLLPDGVLVRRIHTLAPGVYVSQGCALLSLAGTGAPDLIAHWAQIHPWSRTARLSGQGEGQRSALRALRGEDYDALRSYYQTYRDALAAGLKGSLQSAPSSSSRAAEKRPRSFSPSRTGGTDESSTIPSPNGIKKRPKRTGRTLPSDPVAGPASASSPAPASAPAPAYPEGTVLFCPTPPAGALEGIRVELQRAFGEAVLYVSHQADDGAPALPSEPGEELEGVRLGAGLYVRVVSHGAGRSLLPVLQSWAGWSRTRLLDPVEEKIYWASVPLRVQNAAHKRAEKVKDKVWMWSA